MLSRESLPRVPSSFPFLPRVPAVTPATGSGGGLGVATGGTSRPPHLFQFPPPPPLPCFGVRAAEVRGGAQVPSDVDLTKDIRRNLSEVATPRRAVEPVHSQVAVEELRFEDVDFSALSDRELDDAAKEGHRYVDRLAEYGGESVTTLQRWLASYVLRTAVAKTRPHAGEISLRSTGSIVLLDEYGNVIDAKLTAEGDSIAIGDEVWFPCFCVVVGAPVRRREVKPEAVPKGTRSMEDGERVISRETHLIPSLEEERKCREPLIKLNRAASVEQRFDDEVAEEFRRIKSESVDSRGRQGGAEPVWLQTPRTDNGDSVEGRRTEFCRGKLENARDNGRFQGSATMEALANLKEGSKVAEERRDLLKPEVHISSKREESNSIPAFAQEVVCVAANAEQANRRQIIEKSDRIQVEGVIRSLITPKSRGSL